MSGVGVGGRCRGPVSGVDGSQRGVAQRRIRAARRPGRRWRRSPVARRLRRPGTIRVTGVVDPSEAAVEEAAGDRRTGRRPAGHLDHERGRPAHHQSHPGPHRRPVDAPDREVLARCAGADRVPLGLQRLDDLAGPQRHRLRRSAVVAADPLGVPDAPPGEDIDRRHRELRDTTVGHVERVDHPVVGAAEHRHDQPRGRGQLALDRIDRPQQRIGRVEHLTERPSRATATPAFQLGGDRFHQLVDRRSVPTRGDEPRRELGEREPDPVGQALQALERPAPPVGRGPQRPDRVADRHPGRIDGEWGEPR